MYKKYYRRFLDSAPQRLHFAGHSHHYWPDVTRDAVLSCWDDSATHADGKWRHIFGEIVPRARRHVARVLHSETPEQIVFAPNTHEFVNRLISCFEAPRAVRILTTDSEFHSFRRQSARLVEAGRAEVTRVPSEPVYTFPERLVEEASRGQYDLIFISHVFFNSGLVVHPLVEVVRRLPAEPVVVVDGYHGFFALPTDFGAIADRAFYLAGGYKYAQSGEGVCFLHVPKGCDLRPVDTGWFADFGGLEDADSQAVQYSADGMRFAGATFDVAGVYRLNAVMELFEREGITVDAIHEYVRGLQGYFLEQVATAGHSLVARDRLIFRTDARLDSPTGAPHGHFLTFRLPSVDAAASLANNLAARGVVVDYRGDRLRFGFGMYLDRGDVDELFARLAAVE